MNVSRAPAAGSFPTSLYLADLNGDGRTDILTANSGTSRASPTWFRKDDREAECCLVSPGTGTVSRLAGNGDGTFQGGQPIDIGPASGTTAVSPSLAALDIKPSVQVKPDDRHVGSWRSAT
jgi:hypothetical protein